MLGVRTEELAALVAGGEWVSTSSSTYESAPPDRTVRAVSSPPTVNRDKVLLSLERRLREVPPLERISLLNELIAAAVDELAAERSER